MDTKNLKYFELVYEEKSINAAARKLFISPQGLGKIIRCMEEEFHTSFFVRSQHGLLPTENGTIFYEHSKAISREIHTLTRQMEESQPQIPTLHMGFANGILKAIPFDWISRLEQESQGVHIAWCEYENQVLINKMLNSEIDYALVIGKIANENLVQKLLCKIDVCVCVYEGHPFYDKEYITLEMLKNENIIIMNENYRIYHDFLKACEIEGFEPKIRAKTIDGGTLYMWVSQGIGLAISPVLPDLPYQNVREIPFLSNYTWDIYRAYLSGQKNSIITEKMDHLLFSLQPIFRKKEI